MENVCIANCYLFECWQALVRSNNNELEAASANGSALVKSLNSRKIFEEGVSFIVLLK